MECFFPQCLGERGDVAALRRRAVVAEAEVAKLRAQIEHLHDHAVSSGDAHARAAAKTALAASQRSPVAPATAPASAAAPKAAQAAAWGKLRRSALHETLGKEHARGFASLLAGAGRAASATGSDAAASSSGGGDTAAAASGAAAPAARGSGPVAESARHSHVSQSSTYASPVISPLCAAPQVTTTEFETRAIAWRPRLDGAAPDVSCT